MKAIRKREFPMYYVKGKKLFQVVVHMSDAPGSLRSILDVLSPRLNMVGLSTYTVGDGTAILSAFAEALDQEETPSSIQRILRNSSAALEAEIMEGKDGLLVDTFHSGLEVGDEDFMLLRREGFSGVFDQIVKIFGKGGQVLLYEEGLAMARRNARKTASELGKDVIHANLPFLIKFLTASGWGTFETKPGHKDFEYDVTVTDCFECSKQSDERKECDFLRGYFEGSGSTTFGIPMHAEEVRCILRGDNACVFHISPRKEK